MKLRQLAIMTGASLITLISLGGKVLATTTVSAQLDSYAPEQTDIVLGSCSQITVCFPDDSIPSNTSLFPLVVTNDSSFNVTSITLTINPDEDAIWSNGVSDLYNNVQISSDGKSLTFSGGTIAVGAIFRAIASTSSESPVGFSISFQGEASK